MEIQIPKQTFRKTKEAKPWFGSEVFFHQAGLIFSGHVRK